MKITAIFNKKNKKLVAFLSEDQKENFPVEAFYSKDFVVIDNNLERYKLVGDYDDCQLIDLFENKKAVVTEQEVDQTYRELFYRRYNLEQILFALLDDDQTLEEIRLFRKKIKEKRQSVIDFYKNSEHHIYETTEQQINREKQTFET
jgi:hypothetical protein